MILRQATVSEQLRIIELPRNNTSAAAAVPARNLPLQSITTVAAGEVEPTASAVGGLESIGQVSGGAREHRLTFETVAAWLAVQDSATRIACASILVDELTHVHESAKADGLAIGVAQGREEAQQASQRLLDALSKITAAAEAAFEHEQQKLADLCAEIVAEAFAKVAGAALPTREAAIGAVEQVLKRAKEGRELMLRVSPADMLILQQEQSRLAAALPGRKFSLVADARVELGGCIVDSQLGALDGRLEVQLRELYATLRAARSSSQAEQP